MSKIIDVYLEQIFDTSNVTEKVNVACGLIFREIRNEKPSLLVIQRAADDHWPLHFECPRGKCDYGPNEKLIHCLKREIKEETGLDIVPIKFIDKFNYTADKGKRLSTQYNFLCKMKDPTQQVKLSKEHDDFKWISTAGEAEMMILPEMKRTILKAFDLIEPNNKLVDYPENDFTPSPNIAE